MWIDCVYRLDEDGEIIQSQYDSESGVIKDLPERLFSADPSLLKMFLGNFTHYKMRRMSELYGALYTKRDALVVINHSNVGYYVISRKHLHSVCGCEFDAVGYDYSLPVNFMPSRFECIGVVKTKVASQLVYTPLAYMFREKGTSNVYTRFGVKELTGNVDSFEKVSDVPLTGYIAICKDKHREYYGNVVVGGVVKKVYVEGSKLIIE